MKCTCHGCDCEMDVEDARGVTLNDWPLCHDCYYVCHSNEVWIEADREQEREERIDRAEVELLRQLDGED